jgi:multiple sugar transport system permease protein
MRRCGLYGAIAALALMFIFPLVWMASYSLRPLGAPPPTRLELFAPPYAFDNYVHLGQTVPLAQFILNSVRVIVVAVPLSVITASWAGFAMSQLTRRAQVALVGLSVALLLVPAPTLWVPRFVIFTQLGWIDTFAPLVAPALMGHSPFYVIMLYITFARIRGEVYDSARLDGASPLRIWQAIALPIARPTVIAVILLTFADHWSNYVDPLLYLRSEANFTLPVGVKLLEKALQANWPLMMAASVIMVAPVLVIFIMGQSLSGQNPYLERSAAVLRGLTAKENTHAPPLSPYHPDHVARGKSPDRSMRKSQAS